MSRDVNLRRFFHGSNLFEIVKGPVAPFPEPGILFHQADVTLHHIADEHGQGVPWFPSQLPAGFGIVTDK